MKCGSFLLLLILNISQTVAQTNVYHPFPENAVWRIDYQHWNPFQINACRVYYHFHYYFDGDTLINSEIYHKVYRSEVDSMVDWNLGSLPPMIESGYVGALRDDSAANQSFFVFRDTEEDSLLFDYNLNIGDSLRGCMVAWDYQRPVVTSIDSVLIDGSFRNRWNFSEVQLPWPDPESPYFIEGVGSSVGLFEHVWSYNIDFRLRNLVCVKYGNDLVFQTDYESLYGCNFVSTGTELSNDFGLTFYTNPTNGTLVVQSESSQPMEITVFNSIGQTIYSRSNVTNNTIIDLGDTETGIYLVRFFNQELNAVRQVVVQR